MDADEPSPLQRTAPCGVRRRFVCRPKAKRASGSLTQRLYRTGPGRRKRGGQHAFRFWISARSGSSASGAVADVRPGVPGFRPGDRAVLHGTNHQELSRCRRRNSSTPLTRIHSNRPRCSSSPVSPGRRPTGAPLGDSVLVTDPGLLGLFAVPYPRLSGACPVNASVSRGIAEAWRRFLARITRPSHPNPDTSAQSKRGQTAAQTRRSKPRAVTRL